MRLAFTAIAAGAALIVVFALFGPAHPDASSPATTEAAPTTTVSRYGPAIGAPDTTEADTAAISVEPSTAAATEDRSGAAAATTGTAAPTTSTTEPSAPVDGVESGPAVSEATTLIEDVADAHGHDHGHLEEEPENEFPDLAPGEYPVSSNLAEGVEYPVRAMVELAVALLDAEVTGTNRDGYPHLAELVSVCCERLEVDGAAVLFGATASDPATIIIDWHADAAGEEVRLVRGSTRTLWFFRDGTWIGEHDARLNEE